MTSEFPEIWFRGLSDKDKENAIQTLRFNPVVKRLIEIIEGLESEIERDESDYDSPSWAYKEADAIGSRRAYRKIKKLLKP